MDISNKSLAVILVAAIVISIGGTVVSLNKFGQLSQPGYTGYATSSDAGQTNFSIMSNTTIEFVAGKDAMNFGNGEVNGSAAGVQNCTLQTNNTAPSTDCIGFSALDNYFVIHNIGNIGVNLSLLSNATAAQFIGGNASVHSFQWQVGANESGSCLGSLSDTSFTNVTNGTTIAHAKNVCTNLDYNLPTNSLWVNLKLVIPEDAPQGIHQATITAYGVSSS